MKITFDRDVLIKELSIAQEVIATKTALTILSNILLTAKDGKLTMKATDVKVAFETTIPVNVIEEGSTTVFCDKLVSIILSLPQGEIEMEQIDQKMIVKSSLKKARFQLKTIPDNDFPVFFDSTTNSSNDIVSKFCSSLEILSCLTPINSANSACVNFK